MKDSKESMTSKLCSFARAYHSNYEKEKIFDDYLAYDILGKEEYDQLGSLIYHEFDSIKAKENAYFKRQSIQNIITEYLAPIPLSRIKYAEDKLMEFASKNESCQCLYRFGFCRGEAFFHLINTIMYNLKCFAPARKLF